MMNSLSLLADLRQLPADGAAEYSHETAASNLRAMDRDFFALDVAQVTEEAMEALFEARNVPDVLNEAYRLSFGGESQTNSLTEYFLEVSDRGERSVVGLVSSLKGKVAELESAHLMEERFPGYSFEVVANPNQPIYDLVGRGPAGTEDVFIQVKAGAESYAGDVLQRMEEAPEHVYFAVSSELYGRMLEVDPEAADRLVDTGIEVTALTEDVKSGLGTLAGNMGIDVPDSIGEMLPYVGDVVLAIRLISQLVSTEGELRDVEISDRAKVHGIRTLTMMSRFGVTQVCALAGSAGGGAAGSAVAPGVGTAAGATAGAIGGAGAAILLNRALEPRMADVAITIMGGDREEVFYLMNKSAIDAIGSSLAATSAA